MKTTTKTSSISAWKWVPLVALLALAVPAFAQDANLIKNGDFALSGTSGPSGWSALSNKQKLAIDTTEISGASKQSLRVDIEADAGKSLGQIVQKVPVTPNTKYKFKVDAKSTKAGEGVGQIKLLVGSSETKRIPTGKTTGDWTPLEVEFESGESSQIAVVLRYNQRTDDVGNKVWFANASLVKTGEGTAAAPAAAASPASN